jgi:hypothetical protein
VAGRIRSIEKSNNPIRNWTSDLPTYSIVQHLNEHFVNVTIFLLLLNFLNKINIKRWGNLWCGYEHPCSLIRNFVTISVDWQLSKGSTGLGIGRESVAVRTYLKYKICNILGENEKLHISPAQIAGLSGSLQMLWKGNQFTSRYFQINYWASWNSCYVLQFHLGLSLDQVTIIPNEVSEYMPESTWTPQGRPNCSLSKYLSTYQNQGHQFTSFHAHLSNSSLLLRYYLLSWDCLLSLITWRTMLVGV